MTASIDLKPVLGFLNRLERNNNKAWFEAHRERYGQAHAAFEAYVEELIAALAASDDLAGVSTKECMFRLNRDLRFSRDKSPYKTYMSAAIGPGGRKSRTRPYYIQIGPHDRSMVAGGVYMPTPDQLRKWRQAVDNDAARLKKIMAGRGFRQAFGGLTGERLTTAPKGYARDHPDLGLLQLKQLTVVHSLSDKDVTYSGMVARSVRVCNAMRPFLRYLDSIL
jgi:uncharacterized protein (TIGR02453 family)